MSWPSSTSVSERLPVSSVSLNVVNYLYIHLYIYIMYMFSRVFDCRVLITECARGGSISVVSAKHLYLMLVVCCVSLKCLWIDLSSLKVCKCRSTLKFTFFSVYILPFSVYILSHSS